MYKHFFHLQSYNIVLFIYPAQQSAPAGGGGGWAAGGGGAAPGSVSAAEGLLTGAAGAAAGVRAGATGWLIELVIRRPAARATARAVGAAAVDAPAVMATQMGRRRAWDASVGDIPRVFDEVPPQGVGVFLGVYGGDLSSLLRCNAR